MDIYLKKKNGGSFAFDLNDLQVWELLLGSGRSRGKVVPVFSLSPLRPGVPRCPPSVTVDFLVLSDQHCVSPVLY